jgi:hypothetical protein
VTLQRRKIHGIALKLARVHLLDARLLAGLGISQVESLDSSHHLAVSVAVAVGYRRVDLIHWLNQLVRLKAGIMLIFPLAFRENCWSIRYLKNPKKMIKIKFRLALSVLFKVIFVAKRTLLDIR